MLNRDQAVAGTTATSASGAITTLLNHHLNLDVVIASAYSVLIVLIFGGVLALLKWLYDRTPTNNNTN